MNDYRIQHRLMSPDVIEKKVDKKWVVCIAPIGDRHYMIAHKIIKFLNHARYNNV